MKILLLLMSCNNPLYEKEEQACRDTFLKDAEGANISYYFYKGLNDEHKTPTLDRQTHTIYLDADDSIKGTARKTLDAIRVTAGLDYDYLIKTNVSTYLNIKNITREMMNWPGKDDKNIYGARFVVNKHSLNVPFPRGHFQILSKSLVDGILSVAPKLIDKKGMPHTDDTLMCLSLLYHINKNLGEKYTDKLMEVPSVTEWPDYEITRSPEFDAAFSIRCKASRDKIEQTPDNMLTVHKALKGVDDDPVPIYRPVTYVESAGGLFKYEQYCRLVSLSKNKDKE